MSNDDNHRQGRSKGHLSPDDAARVYIGLAPPVDAPLLTVVRADPTDLHLFSAAGDVLAVPAGLAASHPADLLLAVSFIVMAPEHRGDICAIFLQRPGELKAWVIDGDGCTFIVGDAPDTFHPN